MSVTTFEGIVEDGRIHLKDDVQLPGQTKVYVVVPDVQVMRILTPRLAHPEEIKKFQMEVELNAEPPDGPL